TRRIAKKGEIRGLLGFRRELKAFRGLLWGYRKRTVVLCCRATHSCTPHPNFTQCMLSTPAELLGESLIHLVSVFAVIFRPG
ncbi:hypothetical protein KUCAC02_026118, partial [Chaenocephalus aceratus]